MANFLENTKNLVLQRQNIEEGGPALYDYLKRLVGQLEELYEELASSVNFLNTYIQPVPDHSEFYHTSTITNSSANTWEDVPFDTTGNTCGGMTHPSNTEIVINEIGCYYLHMHFLVENTSTSNIAAMTAFRAMVDDGNTESYEEIAGSQIQAHASRGAGITVTRSAGALVYVESAPATIKVQFYTENTDIVLDVATGIFDKASSAHIGIFQIANRAP